MSRNLTTIGGPITYLSWKDYEKNDLVVKGTFVGTTPNQFNEHKPHYLVTPEGQEGRVCLNTTGHLAWAMDQVAVGDYVEVYYMGQEKLEKGKFAGKLCHQFQVKHEASGNGSLAEAAKNVEPTQEVSLDGLD